jgi:hypothetical protein
MRQLKIPQVGVFNERSPKGDSIVSNEQGIYAFGIVEAAQAMFFIRVEADAELPVKFVAAVEEDSISRHRSQCGRYDLVCAIKKNAGSWFMPDKTEEDLLRMHQNWGKISQMNLVAE